MPSTFMRIIIQMFRHFLGKFVIIYFDDILVLVKFRKSFSLDIDSL